ncbi:MAG TPA: hypothetical protein VF070_32725 [Streptosporangiaceae bacterium]
MLVDGRVMLMHSCSAGGAVLEPAAGPASDLSVLITASRVAVVVPEAEPDCFGEAVPVPVRVPVAGAEPVLVAGAEPVPVPVPDGVFEGEPDVVLEGEPDVVPDGLLDVVPEGEPVPDGVELAVLEGGGVPGEPAPAPFVFVEEDGELDVGGGDEELGGGEELLGGGDVDA